ncbi:redoxin domain-containing protein [bacterium]|nr:redoxin domain-containing protein [bacterium]
MQRKILAFLFVFVSLFLFSTNVNAETVYVNDSNYEEEVFDKNSDKIIIVDFYATWCGPCQMQSLVFQELEKDPSMKDVKIVKVNAEESTEAARSQNIDRYPTLMMVKKGRIVGKWTGLKDEQRLKGLIMRVRNIKFDD